MILGVQRRRGVVRKIKWSCRHRGDSSWRCHKSCRRWRSGRRPSRHCHRTSSPARLQCCCRPRPPRSTGCLAATAGLGLRFLQTAQRHQAEVGIDGQQADRTLRHRHRSLRRGQRDLRRGVRTQKPSYPRIGIDWNLRLRIDHTLQRAALDRQLTLSVSVAHSTLSLLSGSRGGRRAWFPRWNRPLAGLGSAES